MIQFPTDRGTFNYRVGGIAVADGHVLLQRVEPDHFWVLPGGRPVMMEAARETLRREMREETGLAAEVGRLVWIVENFFEWAGSRYHEIGLYFEMTVSPVSLHPFKGREGELEIDFAWFPLSSLPFIQPRFIADRLGRLPVSTEHVVWVDGETTL
jgi:ADP-ribose pyrophosphatase YjhB (NUDIX family)